MTKAGKRLIKAAKQALEALETIAPTFDTAGGSMIVHSYIYSDGKLTIKKIEPRDFYISQEEMK